MTKITKKMLALIMAVLTLFSCMAVSASAADTFTIPEDACSLSTDKTEIVVKKIVEQGVTAAIAITPSDGVTKLDNTATGDVHFQGVKAGKTYTIIATVVVDGKTLTGVRDVVVKNIIKNAPATPVVKEVKTTSITIGAISDCEYAYELVGSGVKSAYQKEVTFKNLLPGSKYTIYTRIAETATAFASPDSVITVTTLELANAQKPAKPEILDKTNNTITIKAIDGLEYSIDGGKTWQTSGVFKNLTAGKQYGIIAREVFDATVQEANPVSDILEVSTTKRESYKASISNCKFSAEGGDRYSNESLEIYVTGDKLNELTVPQYGDTRLTPVSFVVDGEQGPYNLKTSDGKTYKGDFIPGKDKSNKVVKVVVTFRVDKYNGAKYEESTELKSATYTVQVGEEKTSFTGIKNALEAILNFFLNTVPKAISDFFNSKEFSDGWDKILKIFSELGKVDLGGLFG